MNEQQDASENLSGLSPQPYIVKNSHLECHVLCHALHLTQDDSNDPLPLLSRKLHQALLVQHLDGLMVGFQTAGGSICLLPGDLRNIGPIGSSPVLSRSRGLNLWPRRHVTTPRSQSVAEKARDRPSFAVHGREGTWLPLVRRMVE